MAYNEINTHNDLHAVQLQESPLETEPAAEASLLTINGTIIVIAISFIIFTLIMQKVFYAPLQRIREKRREFIMGIKTDADQASDQADELKAQYVSKIQDARKKVAQNTNEALTEANEEKAKMLEEKQQDVAKFLEEARGNIRKEQDEAFEGLKDQISEYAFEISKKVLGEEIPIVGVTRETIDKAMNR